MQARGGLGLSGGNHSLLVQVGGRGEGTSSSRYMLCFKADGHQPLCIQFDTDQEKELDLGASGR